LNQLWYTYSKSMLFSDEERFFVIQKEVLEMNAASS